MISLFENEIARGLKKTRELAGEAGALEGIEDAELLAVVR